jgi:tRNA A-37 threonylcarbamoyl transferase component Bud32/tetratricopeptide (TPR) repeat protein
VIGGRYTIINELARGGMGAVYRVLDRLTGRVVTLKQLRVEPEAGPPRQTASLRAERMELAREFQLLASLRHPNVIGVLDYGFDEAQQPFFTMDLEENAQTIVEAGHDRPLAVQVDLLVQTLRALAYITRRGIIHRDIKPANILVVAAQVKLLDFGLSLSHDAVHDAETAGTVAYLAPELIMGRGAPSTRSDLFGFGVVMYELFTGRHPFDPDGVGFLERVLYRPPPLPADGVDPRLEPILAQLLAKDPADRFADAGAVVAAMAAALRKPLSLETVASRESFLQAAAFVGRDGELRALTEALARASTGHGATWLVAGESGVGKSRLLDELRTQALVQGAIVCRGQASSVGGEPYHAWREPVRNLVLRVPELDDRLASELLPLVPDIADMLGRPVAAPPPLDADAAQTRLVLAVERLLGSLPGPAAILLEDLQWAGSESTRLLAHCARTLENARLLLVGSYRDDERPDLPDMVPGTRHLQLGRLEPSDIARLAESMIGPAGRQPALVAILRRETEGIPFFLVEVVRALAEEAGSLARIEEARLDRLPLPGGIQRLLRRRLARVPAEAVRALKLAAIVARDVDPSLMQMLDRALAVDEWSTRCVAAGVLEVREERVRFAHDKLREQLLADLREEEKRLLHERVATALERVHPDSAAHAAALAHHWGAVGNHRKEATYSEKAGFVALQNGACAEAMAFFHRAIALLEADARPSSETPAPATRRRRLLAPNARLGAEDRAYHLGRLEAGLAESHFRLGDLDACRAHAIRAIRYCGTDVPDEGVKWTVGIAGQAMRRLLQVLLRYRSDDAMAAGVAAEMVRVQARLAEAYFFSLESRPFLWVTLVMANQCGPFPPAPELSKTYMVMTLAACAVPVHRLAGAWARRAVEIAERVCSRADLAYLLTRINNYRFGRCEWAVADREIERAAQLAEEVGDRRVWEEARSMQGMSALFQGRFDDGVAAWSEARRSCERSGNLQIGCWAMMGQADNLVRLGRDGEAARLYRLALEQFGERAHASERIWAFGMLALASLRAGRESEALEAAGRALQVLSTSRPVAYWTQYGTAATAEVFLTVAERRAADGDPASVELIAKARRACAAVDAFARVFRLGQPFALLWGGLYDWLSSRRRRAMKRWQRCVDLAAALETPYEQARAHLEIARHLPADAAERATHLEQATTLFRAQRAVRDLARAEAEMAAPDAPYAVSAGV